MPIVPPRDIELESYLVTKDIRSDIWQVLL